jgi:hypothetical protein
VLPFTKRTARDDHEVINTGEIEVLRSRSRPLRAVQPQPRRSRTSAPTNPLRVTRPSSDEEMTRLVPRSVPAPRSWTPPPNVAALAPQADDNDETLVLPPTPPPPAISPFPSARAAEARARAVKPTQPVISPDSIAPMALTTSAPAAAGTVITNRPKAGGRPTAMWTVALVAMGLFAGLASSVVARGDADSIIDATASFVDPARAGGTRPAPPAAAAQIAVAPIAAPTPIIGYVPASTPAATPAPATVATPPAPTMEGKTVAAADLPAAPLTASRDRLPPVAYATAGASKTAAVKPVVTARRAPHWTAPAKVATNKGNGTSNEAKPADEAKDTDDTKVAVADAPAPAPKAGKAAPRGKRHASDDDVASASAADELARAQLEAALR